MKDIRKDTKITKNHTESGKISIFETFKKNGYYQVIERNLNWKTMGRNTKIGLAIYGSGLIMSNIFHTYNNGKSALLQYHHSRHELPDNISSEWHAIQYGCKHNRCTVFWDSVWWPSTIYASVMPLFVLLLNKNIEKKN